MKSIKPLYSRFVWFKRWSRRADAAFLSIGKVVHIGKLKVDICRMAMLKSGVVSILAVDGFSFMRPTSDETDDALPEELCLQVLLSQLIPTLQVKCVKVPAAALAAAVCSTDFYSIHPTSKVVNNLWMWDVSFCQQFKNRDI